MTGLQTTADGGSSPRAMLGPDATRVSALCRITLLCRQPLSSAEFLALDATMSSQSDSTRATGMGPGVVRLLNRPAQQALTPRTCPARSKCRPSIFALGVKLPGSGRIPTPTFRTDIARRSRALSHRHTLRRKPTSFGDSLANGSETSVSYCAASSTYI